MLGVDYASIDSNAAPDLAAARAAGLRFVFVRGSYSTWQDPTAARDRDAIRAAGLTFGAYMFPLFDATQLTPEEQVRVFVANVQLQRGVDLPPVLDLEFPRGIAATGHSRTELAAIVGRFIAALVAAYGVKPMLYSSARVLDDTDADCLAGAADGVVAGCPLWLARYTMATRQTARLDADGIPLPPLPRIAGAALWCHQYAGDAVRMPGFSSTVDLDRWLPLSDGETSARVQWVQARLGDVVGLTPGVNDLACKVAIAAYQRGKGLDGDGVVGPKTFAALAWEKPA